MLEFIHRCKLMPLLVHCVLSMVYNLAAMGLSQAGHQQVVDIDGHVGSWDWVSTWLARIATMVSLKNGAGSEAVWALCLEPWDLESGKP